MSKPQPAKPVKAVPIINVGWITPGKLLRILK